VLDPLTGPKREYINRHDSFATNEGKGSTAIWPHGSINAADPCAGIGIIPVQSKAELIFDIDSALPGSIFIVMDTEAAS